MPLTLLKRFIMSNPKGGLPVNNPLEEISPCEPGVFHCEKLPDIGRLQALAATAPCLIAQWDKACVKM